MKLLIVDDDRVARFLIRRILTSELDAEFVEAADGIEAWDLLQGGLRPDLAFLDVMMPRMGGIELLERIRSVYALKKLKVIFCTAVNERFRMAEANSLDISSYLVKPITPQKLLPVIHSVVNSAQIHAKISVPIHAPATVNHQFEDYLHQFSQLTQITEKELENMNKALHMGDRAKLAGHVKFLLEPARKLGITGLVAILSKLEARIYIDSHQNLISGLDALAAEQRQMTNALHEMLPKRDSHQTPQTPGIRN